MAVDLDQLIDRFFADGLPDPLGVAVSGGSDSLALLILLHRAAQRRGSSLVCVTVDHGLRSGSAAEAAHVARCCADLAVPHSTLTWAAWDGFGNVQAEARRARYTLMADWAQASEVHHVALAHTRDDQAETVLMRLARSAGVDGLSAMAPQRKDMGVTWLRPLLESTREELRAVLQAHGLEWIDDPSNEDTRFERIKMRKSWDGLAELGITPQALAKVAENMTQARAALEDQTRVAAEQSVRLTAGAVQVDRSVFDRLPQEIARRLILAVLRWITGSDYPPRARALETTLAACIKDGSATVDGCHLRAVGSNLWIMREYNAVKLLQTPVSACWDGRWQLAGPQMSDAGLHVAALGPKGVTANPQWRGTGLPREVFLASPAVWRGSELVAVPLLDPDGTWQATPLKRADAFFDAVFSH